MSKLAPSFAAVALAVLLVIAALVTRLLVTIPATPDPDALPSHVLEPPSDAHRDAVEEGRAMARALISEGKLPGLSLAVAVDGEIVWAEGFRWADLENERPVVPTTRFRIGGISQAFTAAAAGLLVERGRLDLDAPVRQYVPSFPEKAWPVSTRHLMAHTAGLRPHRGEGGLFQGKTCSNDAERLAIFADEPLRSRPGTEARYSTYGWVLAGAAIAAAAGEPYHEFVQREIFAPLGMENTVPDVSGQPDAESTRYYYPRLMLDPRYGAHDASAQDFSCYLPAVGFLSTPSDLVRFASAMMGDRLLDPATVASLQTPVQLASGEADHALGWNIATVPMGPNDAPTRIVGHGLGDVAVRKPLSAVTANGQVAGGTASLLLVPAHGIAVAVTANVTAANNVPLLSTQLADVFVRTLASR